MSRASALVAAPITKKTQAKRFAAASMEEADCADVSQVTFRLSRSAWAPIS
jgi:hypothetical protein